MLDGSSTDRIKVLVVDDSPTVRQVIREIFEKHPAIEAVETAAGGKIALTKIERFDPDIVTLDIDMPGMDGLATLKRIMAIAPRPVIMLSAFTFDGADKTIRALEWGAVDFIQKPLGRLTKDVGQVGDELSRKVVEIVASQRGQKKKRAAEDRPTVVDETVMQKIREKAAAAVQRAPNKAIVAIGASTGGTEAIRKILVRLPADFGCGIVVTQHMPEGFTQTFASRLNELCRLEVKEAAQRDVIRPGRALIAPGHSHMLVKGGENGHFVELNKRPKVSGHRPSVDVLFESVSLTANGSAIGVLLTGMGRDGAMGMSKLYDSGALTIAQDEQSSVVYGMPKVAVELGAVHISADIAKIADILQQAVSTRQGDISLKVRTIRQGHPGWL